jgi:capsular polysaccharide biosynthesis protein
LDQVPYAVLAVRRLDPDRLVWTAEAYALAPDQPAPPPEPLPEPVTPSGLWDGAYTATAETSVAAGQVVVLTGSGHLLLACADRDDTAAAAGVVVQGAGSGRAAQWTVDRPVERTDWAMVLESGQARLTPGIEYFLSAVLAGGITDTPPDVPGAWVVPVGRAISATVLHVALGQPVRL